MLRSGILYGVGVGPGDPELVTLKAVKTIQEADILCYIANNTGQSMAREIMANHILDKQQELPIVVQMDKDRGKINLVYDKTAQELAVHLQAGKKVAMLCQGDPLFFGSFIYLYERLANKFDCEIVPGITSISAVSAAVKTPLSYLSDRIAIVSARNEDEQIVQALKNYESIVILKAGPERPRLLELIQESGRRQDTVYVENAMRQEQRIYHDLNQVVNEPGPYFSMFLTTAKKY